LKKEQISKLSNIYKIDKTELETLWLAEQILEVVKGNKSALKAISVAENQINVNKTSNKY
jgi:hypothetical protein